MAGRSIFFWTNLLGLDVKDTLFAMGGDDNPYIRNFWIQLALVGLLQRAAFFSIG